jgi:hypothetical protein
MRLRAGGPATAGVEVALTPAGVAYRPLQGLGPDWYLDPASSDAEIAAFAAQLEELGYAIPGGAGELHVSWSSVYGVLEQDDFAPTQRTLPLPPIDAAVVPALRSSGTLSDPGFGIAVSGWHRRGSGKFSERLTLTGPVCETFMLDEPAFRLLQAVRRFQQRSPEERSVHANRLAWGEIRELAQDAGAVLDRFLTDTIVLRPRMLALGLERVATDDGIAVRVAPTFAGAPDAWLQVFDRYRAASSVYQVVDSAGGYTEIVAEEAVAGVLAEIKRLPGRRVAGPRARQLIENPFAFFAGGRDGVFDEAAIEAELARLRKDAWSFRPQIDLEAGGAGIEITPLDSQSDESPQLRLFAGPEVLETFVRRASHALDTGHAFFSWGQLELEVGARLEEDLAVLREVLAAWREQRPIQALRAEDEFGETVIDAALVLDLSRYHERVESIGIETPYGIITIPLSRKGAWLPEEQELRLLLGDGPGDDTVVAMNRQELAEFVSAVDDAIRTGGSEVPLPRGGKMDVGRARDFVDSLPRELRETVAPEEVQPAPARPRTGLLIKPNIEHADYVTRRASELRVPDGAAALVPSALRPGVSLKAHQLRGLLWLQHLFTQAPAKCRGALLADDMGLGKTLQGLSLIARAREDDPDLDPALVVAPVTLLENWAQEVERFFGPGKLPVLTLYGSELQSFRVPGAEIDERLRRDGLKRFLRPGWSEGRALVLTTYETLRDYEFSFADVRWSIVICDEAQRIKNPNALVSRAAKKLKARFCVAATGTPVENNLTDLWSLFDFIQPGLLDPLNVFNRKYRRPIEARTDAEIERVDELRRIIEPQVLRRTKADVARDLPEKIFDEPCRALPMSDRQRALYSAALTAQRTAEHAAQSGTDVLQLISRLRRICTDPRSARELADPLPPLAEYRRVAPKLDWLLTTLESIRLRGEKAIVFLDRKDIQRLVQAYVREHFGFAAEIINGETPTSAQASDSRQRRIDRFQAREGFSVLILSPVAAGVGLNIQEANHVIHYMRHWNPAKEDQATDRAYRIGQQRDVTVYTPIVVGDGWVSFDERLDELLEKKRAIAANMLNGSDDVGAAEFADLIG